MKNNIIVTTSWDDGHILDLKLSRLLLKYNLKGTFYISPKNQEFKKNELLGISDLQNLNNKFEIGAHTLTHPTLTKISLENAAEEISLSRQYLQNILKKEVVSFCYPKGIYNEQIVNLVKVKKFLLARTTKRYSTEISKNPYLLDTTLNVYNHLSDELKILKFSKYNIPVFLKNQQWNNLAINMFNNVQKNGGVFHLWGHSWEIEKFHFWNKLENVFKFISNRTNVSYITNRELYDK